MTPKKTDRTTRDQVKKDIEKKMKVDYVIPKDCILPKLENRYDRANNRIVIYKSVRDLISYYMHTLAHEQGYDTFISGDVAAIMKEHHLYGLRAKYTHMCHNAVFDQSAGEINDSWLMEKHQTMEFAIPLAPADAK